MKLSKLVEVGIIPNKEKYVKSKESIKNRIHVIKNLIKDSQQVQEDVEGHCVIMVNIIEELQGKLLNDNHKFLSAIEIVQVFKETI